MLAVLYKIQERNDTFFKQAGVQVNALLLLFMFILQKSKLKSNKIFIFTWQMQLKEHRSMQAISNMYKMRTMLAEFVVICIWTKSAYL